MQALHAVLLRIRSEHRLRACVVQVCDGVTEWRGGDGEGGRRHVACVGVAGAALYARQLPLDTVQHAWCAR